MAPKLSIITVNLNNVNGLRKTIESVVNQTYIDKEYIIIDGGSSDGSLTILNEYADKIAYWVSEPDMGIYSAMNKGILQAKGEYLEFLNSGDWLEEETILSKVFETPRVADIIYGHLNVVTERKSKIRRALNENQISLIFFFNTTIAHPSTFIARKLFNDHLYDESFIIAADKKFFVEKIIFQNCTLQQIDDIIVNFNTDGISRRPESQAQLKEENDRIFAQVLPPRILKDYELYKNNYSDIQSLVAIKKNRLSYLVFKVLKKATYLFEKCFSMNTPL